jgi:prophage regulatory protein
MTKLLRLNEVMEQTRKSRSSIYADPTFPKPIKIGRAAIAWPAEEIQSWINARIAERDAS